MHFPSIGRSLAAPLALICVVNATGCSNKSNGRAERTRQALNATSISDLPEKSLSALTAVPASLAQERVKNLDVAAAAFRAQSGGEALIASKGASRALTSGPQLPIGNVDLTSTAGIAGWALDPDFDGPIAVHIYVDGALKIGIAADLFRSDVGSHAFHWAFPAGTFSPGRHTVAVYGIGVDSSGALDNYNPQIPGSSELVIPEPPAVPAPTSTTVVTTTTTTTSTTTTSTSTTTMPPAPPAPRVPGPDRLPQGYVDAVTGSYIAGWAADPDFDGPIAVHIYVDGALKIGIAADALRPDVGSHAFHWEFPAGTFSPGRHTVAVYGIGVDSSGALNNYNPQLPGASELIIVSTAPPATTVTTTSTTTSTTVVVTPTTTPPVPAQDRLPVGSVDLVDGVSIAGWASDPDFNGPIAIHIYVDDVLVHAEAADKQRADVGAHAFQWVHPSFGPGNHIVKVYALGADATGAYNTPVLLKAVPIPFNYPADCVRRFTHVADQIWCRDNPGYYMDRQPNTRFVGNANVRVGIYNKAGGYISQLFGKDPSKNLTMEHAGGAIQLSIWAFPMLSANSFNIVRWWNNYIPWDYKAYTSLSGCESVHGGGNCIAHAFADGPHVADGVSVKAVAFGAGAPWNPIQGSTPTSVGDGFYSTQDIAGGGFEAILKNPINFTKTSRMADIVFDQKVEAIDVYAKLSYKITYTGQYQTYNQGQEIPAIFTANEINRKFYFYGGDKPYQNPSSAVTQLAPEDPCPGQPDPNVCAKATGGFVRLPQMKLFEDEISGYLAPSRKEDKLATEHWWGVCDESETHCLTVASFSDLVRGAALARHASGGYIAGSGRFGFHPGLDVKEATLYVFPYRYDEVVGGKSVRQWIYDLKKQVLGN